VAVHAPVASVRVNLRDPNKGVLVRGVEALRTLVLLSFGALALGDVAQKSDKDGVAMNRSGGDGELNANLHAV